MSKVTLFVDLQCSICSTEMKHLKACDQADNVTLVDINKTDTNMLDKRVTNSEANQVLHAITEDGTLVKGIDATYEAWHAVGKGHWVAFLKWPVSRQLSQLCYLIFARYRAKRE